MYYKNINYKLDELDVINVNLPRYFVSGQITSHLYANLIDKLARILPNRNIILCSYMYWYLTTFSTSAHTAIPRVVPRVVLLADPI